MVKLLLVDDDEINAKVFEKRLKKRGYEVSTLSSGPECLKYFENYNKSSPVLLILDIVMPEMDGMEVLKVLRDKYPSMELPIIMMSAKDESEEVVKCLEKGASDYLTKPANIDIACARINTQISLLNFYAGNLQKKQLETVNSMIATFNHEINNPLTIALGSLKRDFEKIDQKRIDIAIQSLMRIADIVKKIESLSKRDRIEEITYVQDTKMIKLK